MRLAFAFVPLKSITVSFNQTALYLSFSFSLRQTLTVVRSECVA